MIRYCFALLDDHFKAYSRFGSVNELNAYLREREHFVIYIEVQAYDDRDPLKRRRWTNETVTNREWFEHFHDQLYKKIEDDGFGIVFGTEQELHADIRRATEIRYHLELNNYLLIRDKKLYRRLPPGRILDSVLAKHFRKVGHRHWKLLTLDLFYDLESA